MLEILIPSHPREHQLSGGLGVQDNRPLPIADLIRGDAGVLPVARRDPDALGIPHRHLAVDVGVGRANQRRVFHPEDIAPGIVQSLCVPSLVVHRTTAIENAFFEQQRDLDAPTDGI